MPAPKPEKIAFAELDRSLKPLTALSLLMACILQLVSLLPIWLMPQVIDRYIPGKNLRAILLSALIFCGVPLFSSLFNQYYQYHLIKRSRELISRIKLDCFEKLLYQPMRFFDATHSAQTARKCSQEAVSYVAVRTIDIPNLLSGLLTCAAVFWLLFRIHPILAVFQLFYLPLILLLMKLIGRRLEKLSARVVEGNAKIAKYMQEAFHAIRAIKAARLEPFAVRRAAGAEGEVLHIWGQTVSLEQLLGGMSTTLIPGIFYGGSFVLAALLALRGQITLGLLTAALGYASKIHAIFSNLLKTYNAYKKSQGECAAVAEYLQMADERTEDTGSAWAFEKEIALREVSFCYPGADREVLTRRSMVFPKGRWTGISGPSGAGKSTILELLLRFYEVEQGEITIDGRPLSEISLPQLRSHIAYLPQEAFLIEGTIEDNLRLVCEDDKKIAEAARLTGITGQIEGGLRKPAGESGMLLSGGERQRVMLAQCLLRECPVILLDEATSQLDPETQQEMALLFRRLCEEEGTTIISVAHREAFHRYADIRYVLGE